MSVKHCPSCGQTKPIADFFNNTARFDGLQSYCKPCMGAANKRAEVRRTSKRKAAGNCPTCNKVAGEGRLYCVKCSEASVVRHEQNNHKPCTQCGGPRAKKSTQCTSCLRQKDLEQKLRIFDAYGGRFCACCGETEIKFLSLDHILQNGAEHRRAVGFRVYRWLESNGYPDTEQYQILCRNCNWGRWVNDGVCPHKDRV